MSRRLERRELRRRSRAGRLRRLPACSLDRTRGFWREALIGLAGGAAVAGGLHVEAAVTRLTSSWSAAAGQELIVVPEPDAASTGPDRPAESRLAAVLSAAGPGAYRIEPQALASLLGGSSAEIPALIALGGVQAPDLAAHVEAVAPGSVVGVDGGKPAARLAAFGARLRLTCRIVLAALAGGAIAAIVAGAIAGVTASSSAARLLHQMGVTDGAIVRQLAWPLAGAAFCGSAVGTEAVLTLAPEGVSRSPPLAASAPLLAALAALLAAWLAVRARLQADD